MELVTECESEPDAALGGPGVLVVGLTGPCHRSVTKDLLGIKWVLVILLNSGVE